MSKLTMVVEHFRAAITSGVLQPGAKLPTYVQLCEQFNASDGVIREAMIVLKAEGLVEGRQTTGVFVADRKIWAPPRG